MGGDCKVSKSVEIETAKRYITYCNGGVRREADQTILVDINGKDVASVECDFEGFKDLDHHEEQCAFTIGMTLREMRGEFSPSPKLSQV